MSRRRKRRRSIGRVALAGAIILGACGAALLWQRWRHAGPRTTTATPADAGPPAAAQPDEDFSAAERRSLEDVMKRGGAGKRQ